MANVESVRAVINRHFEHVTDLGDGILRGERLHNDKPFAVAYIDLSDSVIERSQDLNAFQERLLGADFFAPGSDLRWNSYLYFLAGPKSTSSTKFRSAKILIEEDRHFARKFVVDEEDLARRLGEGSRDGGDGLALSTDAGVTWSRLLRSASLSILLEQRPRTTTLDLIASGDAFKAEAAASIPSIAVRKDALADGLLRKMTIGLFLRVAKDRIFEFGDVNLIVGANGTGKTSLLEAIEMLYCGRVRRDPDASFQEIVCEVENQYGVRETVKATSVVSTLKARNTVWYGRTDVYASAISQGFTRFNFLDTDAAFRLSSEASKELIKSDLGTLLVGPETSKLWTYLSKLADELTVRLKALDERLPSERRNVELLSDEVRRLREAPSEANTLLTAFRLTVQSLSPKWVERDQGTALAPSERKRLEDLSESLSQVLSACPEVPVTRANIQRRISRLHEVLASAEQIQSRFDAAVKQATEAAIRTTEVRTRQAQLGQWSKLVEVGVPGLAAKLRESEARLAQLRVMLRDQPVDLQLDVTGEYAELSCELALETARLKFVEAQEQERAAAVALSQSVQLGRTVEMLRRDLHDASVAYLERSGEEGLCPVCKTEHSSSELLAKIEALVASDISHPSDSLRRNVQNAKDRLDQERLSLAQLDALDVFRRASKAPTASTVEQLQRTLRQAHEEFRNVTAEVQNHQAVLARLDLAGLDWQSWQQIRDAVAVPMLPEEADPTDLAVVKQALDQIRSRAKDDADSEANARDTVADLRRRAIELASRELATPATSLSPSQVVASMTRLLQQTQSAEAKVAAIAENLPLGADAALENLQTSVEACLLAYDRAQHALQGDEQAKSTLKQKDEELRSVTKTLTANATARTNVGRAAKVLSALVRDYSLERATSDAFNAIKGKISSVFAQIHSPPEYELGNVNEGQLIVRRDGGQSHAVNQVSTGQRAALALSIFLALNDSAKSAPPIVLIDDPVAHIDDLNALSFLDYLRDVAVGCRKQIFFATADVRLAALFQRKFEFLGDKRFRRISLDKQDVTSA